tara:strand:- start:19194 stop:20015 length:822 start_codon:yes stop_codon:yes gene_type:complete
MAEEKDNNNVVALEPSTIETVDLAMFEWLNENMDLHTTSNRGYNKVPVIWVSAERAFQSKRSRDMRDKEGALILPLISLERNGFQKDPAIKGVAWANVPPNPDVKGGAFTITREIKQNKTANFANADAKKQTGQINFPRKNKKIVYETISIPFPVSINVNYAIKIRTEYQQQMNDLLQPFMTRTGNIDYFKIKKDGHVYEAFIDGDFTSESNVEDMGEDERMYEAEVGVRVLAYLVGEGSNQEKPFVVRRENAVEIKIPRERAMLGEDDFDLL